MVRLQGISKAFGGIAALRGVDLEVQQGETLGLVGENGAGKSTLMNVLGGATRPDAGAMWLGGAVYAPASAADARRAGVAFVHQELTIFPNLSIAENLQILDLPRHGRLPWIDRRASAARAQLALERVGLRLRPSTLMDRLSAGERQLVEIARALAADARVLILDEPTTSLGAAERTRLRTLMQTLREGGLSQIFVSHDLEEVRRICDRVTVLRDGQVAGSGAARDLSHDQIVSLMVGRERGTPSPVKTGAPVVAGSHVAHSGAVLDVRHLNEPGLLRDVSLTVARGQVVGLFGLMGAGRSELARCIFGLDPYASGQVIVDGEVVTGGPAERIRRGLALVTEDRRADGLCLQASLAENLTLASLPAFVTGPGCLLDRAAMASAVRRTRAQVGVAPQARGEQPVGTLSGGNQQKIVLGKWLMTTPRVFILDEPTRGIDVGARAEICERLRELAAGGAGLLVISSDLEELVAGADSVLVLRQGRISGQFPRAAFDREAILRAALPEAGVPDTRAVCGGVRNGGRVTAARRAAVLRLLDLAPLLLVVLVVAAFGAQSERLFTAATAARILEQSAPTLVVTVGMTFVLLTAGVDLSVGAAMFVGAGVAGRLALAGQPLVVCALAMIGVGLAFGCVNALLVTRLRLAAFIATLVTLYIGRGLGRVVTETRAINLPDAVLDLGSTRVAGVAIPVLVAAAVVIVGQFVLSCTPFGRQIYALGGNPAAARTVGLRVGVLTTAVYVISGLCAGIAGLLALAQLGAVSPRFGELYELDAITASVLGGTSLFGGQGRIVPGAVLGALLLKTTFAVLVIVQADPYLYPLVTAAVIFAAVLVDSLRARIKHSLIRLDG